MIGRTSELAALEAALSTGGAILEGEAGIGKSTLWNAVLERSGRRVLRARPAANETQLPFAAVADLLEGIVLPPLPAPQRRALEVALHRAESAGPPPDVRAIAGAFLAVLRQLAPVVVAVDDVQWLDASSRGVLEFAVRRLREEPVAVLVARRGEGPPPLGLDGAARVALRPLTRGELHALLEARLALRLNRPLLKRVHAAAAGNPFYALELGRALQRRLPGADEPLPVPATLVDQRLEALPPAVRDLLAWVDTLFLPRLGTVDGPLDAAVAAGMLELHSDRIAFAHPLLAEAVHARVGPQLRAALHARAMEVEPEARALHLALATTRPDAAIAAQLDAAARAASKQGAAETAGRLSEHAARLTPPDDVPAAARRTLSAAYRHIAAGDPQRARELLSALAARLEPGGLRAEALSMLQWVHPRDGGLERSVAIGEQALAETDDPRVVMLMRANLAVLERVRGRLDASEAHAREAVMLTADDPVRHAAALASLGHVRMLRGAGVTPELRRAVELERALPRFLGQGSPARRLGIGLMLAGKFDAAREVLSAVLDRATEAGREDARAHLLANLADLERRAGHWARARELADEMLELSGQASTEQEHTAHQVVAAQLEAGLGELDRAERRATAALPVAERLGDAMCAIQLRSVLGFVALSRRNHRAAVDWLTPASDACLERAPLELGLYPAPYLEAEARIALGDTARATLLANAFALPRVQALLHAAALEPREAEPFERARTLTVLGTIERRHRRWGAARAALDEAIAIFAALGAPQWETRAREELGRAGAKPAGTLSETESRVAELAAAGRSNPEIAAAMFISRKTVEANLSKIYRKLGVRSRVELARRLP